MASMVALSLGALMPPDGTAIRTRSWAVEQTAVAAFMHGRKFIGIERDLKYLDVAVERITASPWTGCEEETGAASNELQRPTPCLGLRRL